MAPPGSSIYELCSFFSVNLCSKNACTAWWWRCKTALPTVVFGLEPFTHVQTAITIIMLSVYSHLPFFSIRSFPGQGSISIHLYDFLEAISTAAGLSFGNRLEKSCWAWSHEPQYIIGQLKVKMQFFIWKVRLLDHRFPKAVAQVALTFRSTWEEHVKTSHGSFIHPQGSKELVGSLETEWKTTNQYLLKEHAWLWCTRRCMFALVPQLNDLLRKVTS
ncbi:hypothetical protein LguiB_001666 [Lonicera macranthoides]